MVNLRLLFFLTVFLLSFDLAAQELEREKDLVLRRNILKINVPSLLVSTFNLQWERSIGPHTSVALGVVARLDRPIFNYIDRDERSPINNLQQRTFALTPEIKYYIKEEAFNGVYVGSYLRWRSDKIVFDYFLNSRDQITNYNWKDRVLHIGALVGYQFDISKDVYIDIWCIGLGLKNSKIEASGLSNYDNTGSSRYIDMFSVFDGLFHRSFSYQIKGRESNLVGEVWRADFRGAGICVGVRF